MDEVKRLGALKGAEIRHAKEVLAHEATTLCHGKAEADKARDAARDLFGADQSGLSESVPTCVVSAEELEQGIPVYHLFERARLCKTKSDARRLISQGGAYVNNERIDAFDRIIGLKDLDDGSILLRAGKKRYLRIVAKD
jgi:tyrosyl-tRNA synthetase